MSVHRTPAGKYQVRWRDGLRNRQRTFDRARDARAFEAERRRQRQLGAFGQAEPSSQRLVEWLRTWWALRSSEWAVSTQRQRAGVIDLWIVPHIGERRLCDLGRAQVRQWRSDIVDSGCPVSQANAALGILSAALGTAEADGLLPHNPRRGIKKLRVAPKRPGALAPTEVERLRGQMIHPRDALAVSLLFYAGLRPGEAFALTWGSVGRVLVVDRSFTAGEVRGTKTNRRRTVELVVPLREELERVRPVSADPESLVLPGRDGQPLNGHNWRQRVWTPACEAAGISAAPYDGRHTYASLLIHEGRSLPYVTAALGHASASTTLDNYTHLFDEARLATAVSMEEAITRARSGNTPDVRDSFAPPDSRIRVVDEKAAISSDFGEAGDGTRTRDIQLGKLARGGFGRGRGNVNFLLVARNNASSTAGSWRLEEHGLFPICSLRLSASHASSRQSRFRPPPTFSLLARVFGAQLPCRRADCLLEHHPEDLPVWPS